MFNLLKLNKNIYISKIYNVNFIMDQFYNNIITNMFIKYFLCKRVTLKKLHFLVKYYQY